MQAGRITKGQGEAAVLILTAWRDPENKEIRLAFGNDVVLFDSYVRAAAAGHAKVISKGVESLQQKLAPIIDSMSKIDF